MEFPCLYIISPTLIVESQLLWLDMRCLNRLVYTILFINQQIRKQTGQM